MRKKDEEKNKKTIGVIKIIAAASLIVFMLLLVLQTMFSMPKIFSVFYSLGIVTGMMIYGVTDFLSLFIKKTKKELKKIN